MGKTDLDRMKDEIESLRNALELERQRYLDAQRQLDRANEEFEVFVSMAAHNLRESLRDVASYSQLMAETYDGRLDSDAGVFLGRIREGASNAQSLLTDVVDYWTTDTIDGRSSGTDMEAVFHHALLSTEKQIAERSATVSHDPLPCVTGEFGILTKVLQHLIRNAIEYNETTSPRVHVSSRRQENEWIFSVQDNGPGIDPGFQGRLFGPFRRLHGKEHPGNGLGLAFCKKVIEFHGGRVWLESTPGEGSTFYFTLTPAG